MLPPSRVVIWAAAAAGAVLLALANLLVSLLVLAAAVVTAWAIARAWSAEPLVAVVPPSRPTVRTRAVQAGDAERLRALTASARELPPHLVADPAAIQRLTDPAALATRADRNSAARALLEAVGR